MNVDYVNIVNLECKIQQLKFEITRLSSEIDSSHLDGTNVEEFEPLKNWTSCGSLWSYVTANGDIEEDNETIEDDLSVSNCSYATAQENVSVNLEIEHDNQDASSTSSTSSTSKKTVSFNPQVTVFETDCQHRRQSRLRRKWRQLKSNIADYWSYERFLIKYRWNKLKKTVSKSSTVSSLEEENETSDWQVAVRCQERSEDTLIVSEVNLYVFFSTCLQSIIVETDMDLNVRSELHLSLPLAITDLDKPQLPAAIAEESEETEDCVALAKDRSPFHRNLLFNYLVHKANSPIELKVAASIVKLNLPLWYQTSLII